MMHYQRQQRALKPAIAITTPTTKTSKQSPQQPATHRNNGGRRKEIALIAWEKTELGEGTTRATQT